MCDEVRLGEKFDLGVSSFMGVSRSAMVVCGQVAEGRGIRALLIEDVLLNADQSVVVTCD